MYKRQEYTRDSSKSPPKPVYVPYNALTTRYVANLLLPGYAANMCSYALSLIHIWALREEDFDAGLLGGVVPVLADGWRTQQTEDLYTCLLYTSRCV